MWSKKSSLRVALLAGVLAGGTVGAVVAVAGSAGSSRAGSTASVQFEEMSQAFGVAESHVDTYGVAVSDWNGDGCDDLYVSRHKDEPRLYRNSCTGTFVDATSVLHLDPPGKYTSDRHPVAFGHFDADGRTDLFISTGGGGFEGKRDTPPALQDQLYHQLSSGEFENLGTSLGIGDVDGSGRFGMWLDYDLDGDLDLFVGHQVFAPKPEASKNLLWRNDGGSLTNAAAEAGVATYETSYSGVATDIDSDGDFDLITVPGKKVSVYLNNGDGTFKFTSLGINSAFSVAPGDYDNDGDPDLFVSRIGKDTVFSVLLRNDGGTWTNVTAAAGADGYAYSGSALWIDVNNDGWRDLFIVREASCCLGNKGGIKQPNVLLLNRRDGTFANVASDAGVTGPLDSWEKWRSSGAWGDFDRDGRPDLVVLTAKWSAYPIQLYLNRTDNGNGWITLHLHQANGNPDAIGAKVWVTAGGVTQYSELTSGTADESQSPPYLMIGVGTSPAIDVLEIRWPDGTTNTFTDVAVNHHYVADKGSGLRPLP